jgi:nucleoside-diphosphate-sugar epimerase
MIYGTGLGLHADSVQIPPLVAQARRSGISRYIGKGLNIWSNVHIADVVELYLLALRDAAAGSFYFVENGQASYREIATAIAQRLGLGPAQSWPLQDAINEWGFAHAVYSFGSNSRVSSALARKELRWQPQHRSVLDWIRNDMRLD